MSDTPDRGNGPHSQVPPMFSQTQAFTLPAECWYMVNDPKISKAELKVTLCALLNYYQVGMEATMLGFTDIVEQTGMSKSSVAAGLEAAMSRGSIFRRTADSQVVYEPGSKKSEPMSCHESCINSSKILKPEHEKTTCHVSEIEPREKIKTALLEFGLAAHVAWNIAMTPRYSLEHLERQLDYILFEHEQGLLPKQARAIPGYIVNRIKFNRIEPQGYSAGGDAWYTAEEAGLIQR